MPAHAQLDQALGRDAAPKPNPRPRIFFVPLPEEDEDAQKPDVRDDGSEQQHGGGEERGPLGKSERDFRYNETQPLKRAAARGAKGDASPENRTKISFNEFAPGEYGRYAQYNRSGRREFNSGPKVEELDSSEDLSNGAHQSGALPSMSSQSLDSVASRHASLIARSSLPSPPPKDLIGRASFPSPMATHGDGRQGMFLSI